MQLRRSGPVVYVLVFFPPLTHWQLGIPRLRSASFGVALSTSTQSQDAGASDGLGGEKSCEPRVVSSFAIVCNLRARAPHCPRIALPNLEGEGDGPSCPNTWKGSPHCAESVYVGGTGEQVDSSSPDRGSRRTPQGVRPERGVASLHRDVRGSAVRRPRGVRGPPGSRGGPAGLPPRPAGGPWRAARRRSSPLARTGSRGRGPLRRRRGRGGAPAGEKTLAATTAGPGPSGNMAPPTPDGGEASRRRHGPRREFPGAKAVAAAAGNRFRERRRTNPERAPRTAGRPRLASARGTRGFARPPPFPGAKAAISPVARTRARAREASRAARTRHPGAQHPAADTCCVAQIG